MRKIIKGRILRDMKNLFEHEEEKCYKAVIVNIFWSNSYVEYESNSDRNKTLSVEKYLNKITPYLNNIINNLKKSDTWLNNFISSIDNDEEHVIHSKRNNIKIMINDEVDEVTK